MLSANDASSNKIKVLFSCSGVGIFNRGIESFFRDAFDGLKAVSGLEINLLKGGGDPRPNEHVVWNLPRTSVLTHVLGKLARRNSYVVEQWSTILGVIRRIRRHRPDIIYYSDANLGFLLYRLRKQIGVPFRLLFSNGGPCRPPFRRTDYVHQVTPFYYREAIEAGEPAAKHHFAPYGISMCPPPGMMRTEERNALRRRLNQPTDRPIVLSVGWIQRRHKRMHYVIEEIARMDPPRPYLQMLGAIDQDSAEIIELAERLLGPEGYGAVSAPYREVFDYYKTADVFALASLEEGFGRVYIEALEHGLPVIAHRHPVMEYVLDQEGIFADLNRSGALTELLNKQLVIPETYESKMKRWESVRDRFSWPVIAPVYRRMFQESAGKGVE